jgi:hypothetical protein
MNTMIYGLALLLCAIGGFMALASLVSLESVVVKFSPQPKSRLPKSLLAKSLSMPDPRVRFEQPAAASPQAGVYNFAKLGTALQHKRSTSLTGSQRSPSARLPQTGRRPLEWEHAIAA